MDVIRHDDPREEPISLVIEKKQRRLHHASSSRYAQHATPVSGVDPGFGPFSALDLSPIGRNNSEFSLETHTNQTGQAIGEAEGYMLRHVRGIKMWQVSPRVPHGGLRRIFHFLETLRVFPLEFSRHDS